MMWQIPLIVLTDALQSIKGINGKITGNMIFWVTFCLVGQPLVSLAAFLLCIIITNELRLLSSTSLHGKRSLGALVEVPKELGTRSIDLLLRCDETCFLLCYVCMLHEFIL